MEDEKAVQENASRKPAPTTYADAAAPFAQLQPPLRNLATDVLREAILTGRYKPGERLVEDRIARDFDISRIPVREALRALATEGLVELRPRRGAVVAVLSHAAACDLIEVRATLEGLNARLAARRRDEALIGEIGQVLQVGRAAVAVGRLAEIPVLNARFHDLLAAAGSNSILDEMMRSLRNRTSQIFSAFTDEQAKQSWDEHEQIMQAVIAGDEEMAEMLAFRHVARAGKDYLRLNNCAECPRGFPTGQRPKGCPNVVSSTDESARDQSDIDGKRSELPPKFRLPRDGV